MSRDWAEFNPGEHEPVFFGSTDGFGVMIRRDYPHLVVPERQIEIIEGVTQHTPDDETPPAPGMRCPKCRNAIRAGSLTYCPKCGLSGFESQLSAQRELAGFPKSEPVPQPIALPGPCKAPVEHRKNRRQKRAEKFGQKLSA